jgi:histidinol-phosphatase (PHP family)
VPIRVAAEATTGRDAVAAPASSRSAAMSASVATVVESATCWSSSRLCRARLGFMSVLPADNHVHTEWSWDAVAGSMERSCVEAVRLGLPSIAFTEHVDATRWTLAPEVRDLMPAGHIGPDERFAPPPFDVEGYLAAVARCRDRFPDLRILSGVELGEPHWFGETSAALLASGDFDRVLGSLHSLAIDGELWLVDHLYMAGAPEGITPDAIVRAYLHETLRMVESSDVFEVLAHVDYPVRLWGADTPFDPSVFEEGYRAVLGALAASGRALEVNTRLRFRPEIVRWWYEAGGTAVSFGSDAHQPDRVAHDFADAAAMVTANGFGAGRDPNGFWLRSS